MHAKSAAAAAAASETGSKSGPLFTLPSRARPPPAAAPADPPEEGMGELVRPSGEDTAAVPRHLETGTPGPSAGQQQWGGFDRGHAAAFPQGSYAGAGGYGGAAGAVGGVAAAGTSATDYAIYGAASQQQQQQQQQTPYYHPYAAGAAAGSCQPEFGGGGAKATRRKGRDMERALARGNLGALGSEMPVMDLEQGSNEYNPLRTKPTTAAMNQEQKHIESSVYDPSTGKTVKTLEPTSMQKRKHQINQLAAQAASMERDLMERSGASRLTKAQTHAKYGW
ncbi:conserved unknown protein [Ectocarpus siliculosus]|uniref:Uncharacterized protein n=1 Tax=Ectocarpus siliculosus TaxID=2880 RepID=D8LC39_ECTSI|nr:conserved unknown protein [Ectocarpus siliculosus]|eukprot:CBN79222.1 conserved unknown protein [Ectocarpus siliculosus]